MHLLASALKNANKMRCVEEDAVHLMHASYSYVAMHVGICTFGGWGGLHTWGGGYLPQFAVALRSPIEGRGQRGRCRGAATDKYYTWRAETDDSRIHYCM